MNNYDCQLIRNACDDARWDRLNHGLRTLANWAQSRAENDHNTDTTIAMLERKVTELRIAVDKAGWDAVAELAGRLTPPETP